MSVIHAVFNRIRARRRLARAIRILELERTRRTFQIVAVILTFWAGACVLILLDMAGLIRH